MSSSESRADGGRDPLTDATSIFGEALGGLLRVAFARGKVELERAASEGRHRLELHQLRKDRNAMYAKLGREVRALQEGGELQHPGVARAVERIRELDDKIQQAEARPNAHKSAEAVVVSGGEGADEGGAR
jgi:hypothetical protein